MHACGYCCHTIMNELTCHYPMCLHCNSHAINFCTVYNLVWIQLYTTLYHKVREYFVYRDDHGLGSMAIHLAHHCFSFNMRSI